MDIDNVRKNKNILWDFANFNSVPNSMLTIFQVLTLEWAFSLTRWSMSANPLSKNVLSRIGTAVAFE